MRGPSGQRDSLNWSRCFIEEKYTFITSTEPCKMKNTSDIAPLRRCYMSAIAFQIAEYSTDFNISFMLATNIFKAPHHWLSVRESTGHYFPHKVPVMLKAFPYHDVIMSSTPQYVTYCNLISQTVNSLSKQKYKTVYQKWISNHNFASISAAFSFKLHWDGCQ